MQLQKAAKILDSGAARATRFLWRYPTARLILLFYLVRRVILCLKYLNKDTCYVEASKFFDDHENHLQVFVHLFLMYLLHRLQVWILGHVIVFFFFFFFL